MVRKKRSLFALLVLAVGALLPVPASAAGPGVVASGFDSPRGVAFFHGRLVVAEAGHGGPNCAGGAFGTPGAVCIGRTSQISWVNTHTGTHSVLVGGLFSSTEFHAPGQGETLGVDGISTQGGKLLGILGSFPQAFNGFPCAPANVECAASAAAARDQAGHLISVSGSGEWHDVASVGASNYDFTATIPGQEHDANPYGVMATEDEVYVVDAGSNTLNRIESDESDESDGEVTVEQYFPWRNPTPFPKGFPSDEVPTCVAQVDESLWIGTLSGHLFRLDEDEMTLVADTNLKHVTGCTADEEGNLYLVNMWSTPGPPSPFTGNIVRHSTETGSSHVLALPPLNFPNMDVIGPDGDLYVSADSVCPASGILGLCPKGGSIWRIPLE